MTAEMPSIELRSTNWLHIDRQLLRAPTTTPEQLAHILVMSREIISRSLDSTSERNMVNAVALGNEDMSKLNPRPWVYAIQLGERGSEPTILTSLGIEPPREQISKTLHYTANALIPELRDYWEAVESVDGFYPRAQSHLTGYDDRHDGTWLQIRDQAPLPKELAGALNV
jgi:hypothetical protein